MRRALTIFAVLLAAALPALLPASAQDFYEDGSGTHDAFVEESRAPETGMEALLSGLAAAQPDPEMVRLQEKARRGPAQRIYEYVDGQVIDLERDSQGNISGGVGDRRVDLRRDSGGDLYGTVGGEYVNCNTTLGTLDCY